MILKAVEELARVLCEVSPSGECHGVQVVLPDKQWKALALEMHAKAAQSRMYLPHQETAPKEPTCVRVYTQCGEVTIRMAP